MHGCSVWTQVKVASHLAGSSGALKPAKLNSGLLFGFDLPRPRNRYDSNICPCIGARVPVEQNGRARLCESDDSLRCDLRAPMAALNRRLIDCDSAMAPLWSEMWGCIALTQGPSSKRKGTRVVSVLLIVRVQKSWTSFFFM